MQKALQAIYQLRRIIDTYQVPPAEIRQAIHIGHFSHQPTLEMAVPLAVLIRGTPCQPVRKKGLISRVDHQQSMEGALLPCLLQIQNSMCLKSYQFHLVYRPAPSRLTACILFYISSPGCLPPNAAGQSDYPTHPRAFLLPGHAHTKSCAASLCEPNLNSDTTFSELDLQNHLFWQMAGRLCLYAHPAQRPGFF
jgi:hypothetical protein